MAESKNVGNKTVSRSFKYAKDKGISIDTINGHDDHVHILLKLNRTQSLARAMHLIKGESARWANKARIFEQRLMWAKSYFASSVDHFKLEKIRNYIINQSERHKKFD